MSQWWEVLKQTESSHCCYLTKITSHQNTDEDRISGRVTRGEIPQKRVMTVCNTMSTSMDSVLQEGCEGHLFFPFSQKLSPLEFVEMVWVLECVTTDRGRRQWVKRRGNIAAVPTVAKTKASSCHSLTGSSQRPPAACLNRLHRRQHNKTVYRLYELYELEAYMSPSCN